MFLKINRSIQVIILSLPSYTKMEGSLISDSDHNCSHINIVLSLCTAFGIKDEVKFKQAVALDKVRHNSCIQSTSYARVERYVLDPITESVCESLTHSNELKYDAFSIFSLSSV